MKRRGFTLIEVLICIAIIAVVAAITFPVIAKSKESAKKATTISNLRQYGVIINLYREDYGGGAPTGTPDEMALPFGQAFYDIRMKEGKDLRVTQRGPMFPFTDYLYYVPSPGGNLWDEWKSYSEGVNGNVILLADFTFNSKSTMDMVAYPKLGIGVYIDGSVKTRSRPELPFFPAWWHD